MSRLTVLIDEQNIMGGFRRAHGVGPGHFHPLLLAARLAAERARCKPQCASDTVDEIVVYSAVVGKSDARFGEERRRQDFKESTGVRCEYGLLRFAWEWRPEPTPPEAAREGADPLQDWRLVAKSVGRQKAIDTAIVIAAVTTAHRAALEAVSDRVIVVASEDNDFNPVRNACRDIHPSIGVEQLFVRSGAEKTRNYNYDRNFNGATWFNEVADRLHYRYPMKKAKAERFRADIRARALALHPQVGGVW